MRGQQNYIPNSSLGKMTGNGARVYGRGEVRSISTQNNYNSSKYLNNMNNKDSITNNYNNKSKNNNINEAFQIIQNELRQKDIRILELEKQVSELKLQIQKAKALSNSSINNNEENNNIYNNNLGINYNLNSGFNISSNDVNKKYIPKYSQYSHENKLNNNNNVLNENINGQKKINNYTKNLNNNNNFLRGYNNINIKDDRRNGPPQKPHYESDSEKMIQRKIPPIGVDPMGLTGNSFLTSTEIPTKLEVKTYLKEVRAKVKPSVFKEFIENIKLLTDKNNAGVNKQNIILKVKLLFGNEYQDLFEKFESILGIKNLE